MAYDTKCYELAEAFLNDRGTQPLNTKPNIGELAQRIQDAIEDFILEKRDS